MTDRQIIETLAKKVMGWHKELHFDDQWDQCGEFVWCDETGNTMAYEYKWNPLQNIADAWQVLKRLEATGWEWEMKAANYSHPSIKLTHDLLLKVIYAHGEDDAKTICNAAMKVIA